MGKPILSKPYLAVPASPWRGLDPHEPNVRTVVALDISIFYFNKNVKLDGYFTIGNYRAESWWIGGMMKYVVETVHILTDDVDDGIFCGYCMLNDPDSFMLLGKLKDGDQFTEKCRKALLSYAA